LEGGAAEGFEKKGKRDEFASSRARRRTFRIPPFQQKRDAYSDEHEWPDPKRIGVNHAHT
jgi:hypothetical protein